MMPILLSHMIFSFFNDKRLLAPKYSGATSLEVLRPFYILDLILQLDAPPLYILDLVLWLDQPILSCIKDACRNIIEDYKVRLQIVVSLANYTRDINYTQNMFIVQGPVL